MYENLIFPVLLMFFTALITWFFARKKNKVELSSKKLDNEIKSAKYYQGLLDDLSTRLDQAIEKIKEGEERHLKLMEINRELVEELQKFKQLNGKEK